MSLGAALTDVDAAAVTAALRRDGICVVPALMPLTAVRRIREEALALAASSDQWLVHHESMTGFFVSFSPLVASKLEQDHRVRHIAAAFGQPTLREVCRQYLGVGWHVERVIVDRKEVGREPLTGWHADQFKRRGRCVKFMLYLNDVGPANGAFSYVRGSHRLIGLLVDHARGEGLDNRALHTYEEIQGMAARALAEDRQGSQATRAILAEAAEHIRAPFESDDHYSVAAPAGSVVVFDANGIHRGGVVREGERFVVRCHCHNLQAMRLLSSRAEVRTLAERLYHRWKTPADQPSLV